MKFKEFMSAMKREPTTEEIELADKRLGTKKARLIIMSFMKFTE